MLASYGRKKRAKIYSINGNVKMIRSERLGSFIGYYIRLRIGYRFTADVKMLKLRTHKQGFNPSVSKLTSATGINVYYRLIDLSPPRCEK